MSNAYVSVEGIARRYPGATTIFEDVWFDVAPRRIRLPGRPFRLRQDHVLNILAGLEAPRRGRR